MKSMIQIWAERQAVKDKENAISRKAYLKAKHKSKRDFKKRRKHGL